MADNGTTVYILAHGKFIVWAGTSLPEACEQGLKILDHVEIVEHGWETDPYMTRRTVLKYKPRRSGRWNVSDIAVTSVTLRES